uniref:SUEL-type lectin domain-containing protein n=1 Tax=Branchiostoma floridae TaxID=7739 RepID=C3YET6_BRAFL|eukprot:XP_002605170.1 hypothetical protein BRAFLDRAFT_80893 [Branchiostoma floridae]
MSQSITGENNPTNHREQEGPTSPLQHEDNPEPDDAHVLDAENTAEPTRMSACLKVSSNSQGQEIFMGENAIYRTNPEELTSPLQNEEKSDVLYTDNTADQTRMSTCGKGSLKVPGHNISEEDATYVIGNEPEDTSQSHMITNAHFYVIPHNNDVPSPSADVYFVSDKYNTEDLAMYTASTDSKELDPNNHGHAGEEPKVEQAGSTVAMNSNANRDADRSQPDTSEDDAKDEACHNDLSDDGDIQPYAVAHMRDHETYLRKTASRAPQTEGCSDADKRGHDPDAQEAQNPRSKGFPNPIHRANVPQQASEDTGVHDIQAPSINANDLEANPTYVLNAGQQASDDTNGYFAVRRCCLFAVLAAVLFLVGAIAAGILKSIRGTNLTNLQVDSNNGTKAPTLESINYGTNQPILDSINYGTNTPNHGSMDGTNATILGGIIGTNVPNLSIDGTNPPNVGITNGTNPPDLGSIDGTHGTNPVSCKTGGIDPPIKDKLLVIDDAFFGRRTRETMSGCKCGWFSSCNLDKCGEKEAGKLLNKAEVVARRKCQGLQQCNMKVSMSWTNFGDPCPNTKKYLEVTYHCEEKKERVSSRLATGGPYGTTDGLAVYSDNEIFVTHSSKKTIQVFSMKGAKLRNIPTGDMNPCGIATGPNNSLWVVLQGGRENRPIYENAVSHYRKDGHVLAKYNCNGRFRIHAIAVDKLADKIILTIERRSGGRLHAEFVWFSLTHTQGTPTCNMSKFGSIEGEARHSVAVDKRGNIFIADKYNDRVLRYDKNGVYLSSFGSRGTGVGYLYHPSGICVDSWGRVIVADSGNARVEMFTAEGDHVCTVAYINNPLRVAIGGEGQIVVSNHAFVTILPKH